MEKIKEWERERKKTSNLNLQSLSQREPPSSYWFITDSLSRSQAKDRVRVCLPVRRAWTCAGAKATKVDYIDRHIHRSYYLLEVRMVVEYFVLMERNFFRFSRYLRKRREGGVGGSSLAPRCISRRLPIAGRRERLYSLFCANLPPQTLLARTPYTNIELRAHSLSLS